MTSVAINQDQQAKLQVEVQRELEKREWAEPGDNVMAEYITVLIANGSDSNRVHNEMEDLVGSDFDSQFLDWLFSTALEIQRADQPRVALISRSPTQERSSLPERHSDRSDRDRDRERERDRDRDPRPNSRLLNSALAPLGNNNNSIGEKRKAENGDEYGSQRKVSNRERGERFEPPSGPRMGPEGRGLADRLSGRSRGGAAGGAGGGFQVRGVAGSRSQPGGNGNNSNQNMGGAPGMGMNMGMNQMGGFNGGFAPGMMQPGFGTGFFPPGQQEMMAQMMMMQANMAQMGEMMQKMVTEKNEAPQQASGARPPRPPPTKIPHGTKLGGHSVSTVTPKSTTPGPIPDKPSSKALCRYSVGCSNSRCPYSHPSPAADEKTGMVLSEEACEAGRKCKDAECIKSHASPAATLGESAGPSRMLCKYQNCTNPSCPFRHEDANGNPIPPPALTAAKAAKEAKAAAPPTPAKSHIPVAPSSDNEDGDEMEVVMNSKGLMDGALDDSKPEVKACRYAERCTRADCRFSHPPSRPTPKSRGGFASKTSSMTYRNPATNGVGSTGMNISKKFGAAAAEEKKLDPSVGEFVPKVPQNEEKLEVTM